jgi:hypothetical protein
MAHGVVIAMLASGIVFAGVSLATKPSAKEQLAPFFEYEALGVKDYYSKAKEKPGTIGHPSFDQG